MEIRFSVATARALWLSSLAMAGLLAGCDGTKSAVGADDITASASIKAALPPAQAQASTWTAPIPLTLVPAAGAVLANGKVLLWAADSRTNFGGNGHTWSDMYDPATNTVVEKNITETNHDMFCPGTARLPDGRLLVNGGLDAGATSIYDPATNTWAVAQSMNTPRGYNSTATLQDGSIFTLGGSWSGPNGSVRNGEVFTLATGWRQLSGVPEDPYRLDGTYAGWQSDAHDALIPTSNGKVLMAGPAVNMAWIDTSGNGSSVPAGRRGDDIPAFGGPVVMYDAGKILKVGGSTWNNGTASSATAYIIDTTQGMATVTKMPSMAYPRLYANSVVLPNGQVLVIGGQSFAQEFSDSNAILAPELFDPATQTFTVLPAMSVARNYHSIALLLPDARVISAGGGLCDCAGDHKDMQIMAPPYLFNADGSVATRPKILTAPATVGYGTTATVTTDSPVTSFSLIRVGATTHTVNNGQRRVALSYVAQGGNSYQISLPSNPGILIPGQWMLFAMNAQGTPSVAPIVLVSNAGAPVVQNPGTQTYARGTAMYLALSGTDASPLTWSAGNLPPGVSVDAAGAISGTPTTAGTWFVTISASDGTQTVSTDFVFGVSDASATGTGTGLTAQYYANPYLQGSATVTRIEQPYSDWGTGSPAPGVPVDGFSARWSGSLEATATGTALISTNTDDGVRVWVGNTLIIDNWTDHGPTVDIGSVNLVAGQRYPIMVEYYENAGGANMQLSWQPSGTAAPVAIPANRLYAATILPQSNIAQGKAATQSATQFGASASRAVDGNVDGVFADGSVTATPGVAAGDWWQVDLGSASRVDYVQIWNRTDCCDTNLANFTVFLSSTDMTGKTLAQLQADPSVSAWQVGTTHAVQNIGIPVNKNGRFVRIQMLGQAQLALAEVVVLGAPGAAVYHTPTIAAVANQLTPQGTVVNLAPTASDPDGNALSWTAIGLPTGLSVSATTGAISGTASAAGSYTVTLTVANAGNLTASTSFTWTVSGGAPVIASVPAPVAASGSTVSYAPVITGDASAATFSYDFGDGTSPTAAAASPNATHTYAAPGTYSVTLTMTQSNGTTSSQSFLQAVSAPGATALARASSNVMLEPRSGANARLWVVNQDNDTVSVFDSVSGVKQSEINVGSSPRAVALGSDGSVWVTNKLSATLSKINPATLAVTTVTLPRASQPFGIVVSPADGSLFVALEATGQVLKLGAAGTTTLGTLGVGAAPRHLALTAAGDQLLVSRFITRPLPGEGTAVVSTTDSSGNALGGEVLVVNAASMTLVRTLVLANSTRTDTEVSGRGVPNYLGAAAISPDGKSAWIPSKQDNILRGTLRDGNGLNFQNTVRSITSRINLTTNTEDLAGRVDLDNAGLASAALYHPSGVYLFVALETNRQVAVLDAFNKRELFRYEVGLAPEGLALSADGLKLYVSNFMDRSVSVVDLTPLINFGQATGAAVATWKSVATEKLAAAVLKGKQLFYDARDTRLARDSYMSCATCHNDGGHDGRTWDFTGQGEGLRNTIALKGRGGMGQGFLHWSANFNEVQDFEGQIRTLAGGTGLMSDAQFNTGTRSQPLGDNKAGVSTDLDALAAYLTSLNVFASSPYRNADGTLTTAATAGKTVFQTTCVSCHGGPNFTLSADATQLKNIGTLKPSSGSRLGGPLTGIDIPTLRDVWGTQPYLHDGSAAALSDAVAAHNGFSLSSTDLSNVVEYVRQIGGEEAFSPGTQCGGENNFCYLPNGIIATVSFGANGNYVSLSGLSGNVSCNLATFGSDPAYGTYKYCYYVKTGTVAGNTPAPTVTLAAAPASVASGATSTLTWSSTNATACTATGGWTGAKGVSGTFSTPALTASTTFSLSCTGAGGTSAPANATVTVTAAPTVTFSAAPASVASGATSTLTWSSTNATACTATGGWTGAKGVSGTFTTAALTATTTYTLTCTGAGGTSAPANATVTVTAAPTVTFSALPASIASGATSTLTWSSANATACTATGGWSGAKGVSGTFTTAALTATTTYTLTCTGTGGTSAPANATVTVTAAPTVTFSALPTSVTSGATSTLSWSTTSATACTATGGWSGAQATSGTFTTPALTATTVYTLTCSGAGGTSAPANATVTVVAPTAPTATLTALPTSIASGATSKLTWSSTNATACTATGGWSGAQATSGTFTTPVLTATTVYTLTCSGAGGTSAPANATVTVVAPTAPTVTLTALPTSIASGATSTLTWSSTNATACTATGGWSGAQATSGTLTTTALTATTVYTLTCSGAGGTSVPANATVTVAAAVPTVTVSASPTSVSSGATSTLTWSSTNATSCTATGGWSGAQATSGTIGTAALLTTTTYTLTCSGAGGTSQPASATVTVIGSAPAPTAVLTALPSKTVSGYTSKLTWSSTNATACTASGGWSGTKATSGTFTTPALAATTVFTLVCTGAGGSATANATVTIAPPGAGDGTWCASENGTCVLPAGKIATVYFGPWGSFYSLTGLTGSVTCSYAVFGDPAPGTGKACYYMVTGNAP